MLGIKRFLLLLGASAVVACAPSDTLHGRFATLDEVVDHYDDHFRLNLSAPEKHDLIQYLRSL